MDGQVRILLADDHPLVRSGVRVTLGDEPDLLVVGEATDGLQARRMALDVQPNVLLLDLSMPGPPAHETVIYLRQHCPQTKVLILTAYDDDAYVQGLVAAGVAGYVLKDEMPETVVSALRTVVQGDTWFSSSLLGRLGRRKTPASSRGEFSWLTPHELQTLVLVMAGRTDREIGEEMNLAERTVRYRLRSVYDKLGVEGRVEAAVRAAELGLGKGSTSV